jgi:MFS family permease
LRITLSENAKSLLTIYTPSLVLSFGTGMTAPAIPLLASSFGVSVGLAAQVVTAQIIGRLLFVLPAGVLVDRVGPKKAMLLGPAILSIAAVTAGLSESFPLLLVAMFFQGAGNNLWQIAREVALINLIRADQRGRALSAFFGIGQIGTALGPVMGGVITDLWGFHALFFAYAALGLLVMAISMTLKEAPKTGAHRPASMFDFGRLGDLDPMFRTTFLVLIFATFCMMLRGTVFSSMVPLYVGVDLGYSATQVGSLFGLVGIISVVMIIPAGFLSDKIGRKAATVPAAALTGLSFLVLGTAESLPLLTLGAAIHGLGSGFGQGSMTTSTFDIAPEGSIARFQSLRRFAAELGTLSGPPLAGGLASIYSPRGVFLFFAPVYFISASLLAFVARETHPSRRPARPANETPAVAVAAESSGAE